MPPTPPLTTLILLLLLTLALPSAAADDLQGQRKEFRAAKSALERGDLSGYRKREKGLQGYVLYPYLRYLYLRKTLGQVEEQELTGFLERYDGTTWAERLRRAWLERLADGKQWRRFLELYREEAATTALRCDRLQARLATGTRGSEPWPEVEALWLVGKSQHQACDPAFAAWRKAGRMTRDKVMERITLAMEQGSLRLVTYLKQFLPADERQWVERWQEMHRRPERELPRLKLDEDPLWSTRLLHHGIQRLARRDAEHAMELWDAAREALAAGGKELIETERHLALRLALQHRPEAVARLARLPVDETVSQWLIRAALWQGDWPALLKASEQLSAREREEAEWKYWRAYALERSERKEEALKLYRETARCRCFYGFLAAAEQGLPPELATTALVVEPWELEKLAALESARRTREFLDLGLRTDARREWWHFTRDMDDDGLRVAAKLAHQWGWHDRAILTLGRTNLYYDLELRFPIPFREEVETHARLNRLDPAFVYAVMRQESAFRADVRSSAGALGLMQLMPATARRTAQLINRPRPSNWQLQTADTNIRLGTAHLRHLLDRFDDNRPFTAAGYNAGPHRVRQWQPEGRDQPMAAWIENIPFNETRDYVKRILAYTEIYEWRLGRTPTPITRYLPEVKGLEVPKRQVDKKK